MNKGKKVIKNLEFKIVEKTSQSDSIKKQKPLNIHKFHKKKFSKQFKKFNYKKNKFIKRRISN